MIRTVLFFLLSAAFAFAQLDSNSITVSASRSTNLQPDQIVFAIFVDGGPDATLDSVLTALGPAGITMANFAGVGTVQGYSPTGTQTQSVEWAFGLPVPLAKMKDTTAALTSLQQNIAQNNSALTMSFSVNGTQVSPQTQQSQTCVLTDVLGDAKAQAQNLATAAGLTLGGILALAGSTSVTSSIGPLAPGTYLSRYGGNSSAYSQYLPPCSLTVKFAAK